MKNGKIKSSGKKRSKTPTASSKHNAKMLVGQSTAEFGSPDGQYPPNTMNFNEIAELPS